MREVTLKKYNCPQFCPQKLARPNSGKSRSWQILLNVEYDSQYRLDTPSLQVVGESDLATI